MVELRFYLTVLSLEDREFEHPDDILAEHQVILAAIESGDTATGGAAGPSPHRDECSALERDPGRARVSGRSSSRRAEDGVPREFAVHCVGDDADRAVLDGAIALAWTGVDRARRNERRHT